MFSDLPFDGHTNSGQPVNASGELPIVPIDYGNLKTTPFISSERKIMTLIIFCINYINNK